MAVLIDPPLYLSPTQLTTSIGTDYDFTGYSGDQISYLCAAATGKADAIMRRSLLPTERTKCFYGNGTARINLGDTPLIYIRSIRFALPGTTGFVIPATQLLIDYQNATIEEFTPFVFSGAGYISVFPDRMPLDITYATGYNFSIAAPSDVTITDDAVAGAITPGQYDIAVTTLTMDGESTATPDTATTTSGSFLISFSGVLGGYGYRIYAAPTGTTTLKLVAELPNAQFISTSGAYAPIAVRVTSISQAGAYPLNLPLNDTTTQPFPSAVIEATRILAMQTVYELNNLANRGIQSDRRQDGAATQWRGTQGSEGKGEGWFTSEAKRLLEPYSLQAIF